jgi:hypothetical protein
MACIDFLLKQQSSFGAMQFPFVYFEFHLLLAFAVVRNEFEAITLRRNLLVGHSLRPYPILYIQLLQFLLEFLSSGQSQEIQQFHHLIRQHLTPILLELFRLFHFGIGNVGQLLQYFCELFKRHFLVALCILLKEFSEEGTVDKWANFADFEVLAEYHEFVYSEDVGLMHNLLECWVLSHCVAEFAVVFKYYL